MRRRPRKPKVSPAEIAEPESLGAWMLRFLEHLRVHNYSPATVEGRDGYLATFLAWCKERGLVRPGEITRAILQRYQRHLFHHRKANGSPLSFRSQHNALLPLLAFFKWLTRQNVILYNPAGELELPRVEQRLPRSVLSPAEVQAVLEQPEVDHPTGIRDRAILETLYSTGIRRAELASLKVFDLDLERGTVMVRQGKGKKDRMVPIGEQAVAWTEKYLQDVRPGLVVEPDDGTLFLTSMGEPYYPSSLTRLVGGYVDRAELGKRGSCHLLRHACATAMLEGGADIRFIQEMLGHALLSTTQIYTRVAITKLKQIHAATHPTSKLARRPDPHSGEVPAPPGSSGPPADVQPPAEGSTLDDELDELEAGLERSEAEGPVPPRYRFWRRP